MSFHLPQSHIFPRLIKCALPRGPPPLNTCTFLWVTPREGLSPPTKSKHTQGWLKWHITQKGSSLPVQVRRGGVIWDHIPIPTHHRGGSPGRAGPSIAPDVGPMGECRELGLLQSQGPLLSPSSTLYLWPSCWILRRGLQGRESREPWLCARCGARSIMPPPAL